MMENQAHNEDVMLNNESHVQNMVDSYKSMMGASMSSEQISRITRFMSIEKLKDVMEFRFLLLLCESYLAVGGKVVQDIMAESQNVKGLMEIKGISEASPELVKQTETIKNSSIEMGKNIASVLGTISKVEASVINSGNSIQTMKEEVTKVREVYADFKNKLAGDLIQIVAESLSQATQVMSNSVKEQVKQKELDFQWSKTCVKSGLFLTIFTVFASSFFFMGLLSYGKGFPAWIVVPKGNGNPIYPFLATIFGLPMSWVIFLGVSCLSGVWLYEASKSKSENWFVEFVQNHWNKVLLVLIVIGLIVALRLYGWFF